MPVTCPANITLDVDEATCYASKHPGLMDFYAANGWAVNPDTIISIVCDHWYGAGVTGHPANVTLREHLIELGCSKTAPPAPTPLQCPPGYVVDSTGKNCIQAPVSPGPAPTPTPTPGTGIVDRATDWISDNPLPAVLIAAGAFLVLKQAKIL